MGDARSFSGLRSKISPLGSMLNFDADVKKRRPCVTNMKTASVSVNLPQTQIKLSRTRSRRTPYLLRRLGGAISSP